MVPTAMARMMTPQPYQLIEYRQASPASIVKNTRIGESDAESAALDHGVELSEGVARSLRRSGP